MATAPKTHKPIKSGSPRQEYDKRRGSAVERGYDWDWHKRRKWYANRHPLCEDCESRGLTVMVDEVDHVIPIDGKHDRLRLDTHNLRSRCKACHVRKTRMDAWIRGAFDELIRDGIEYEIARDSTVARAATEQNGWGAK